MAKVRKDPNTGQIIGKFGKACHYNRNGKPLVRKLPDREKPFTVPELRNQGRFRLAQLYAAAVLTDAVQRARYQRAAEGVDASAQNIAVSDFYHSPVVTEVDLTGYTGRAGEGIRIRAEERRIGAAEVRVRIVDGVGTVLEEGMAAVEPDGMTWWYVGRHDLAPGQLLAISVTAIDQPQNRTTKIVRHISG